MDHYTTDVETDDGTDPVAVALTGPPASGKSTVRKLFSDYGCVTTDLESHHIAGGGEDPIVSTWRDEVERTLRSAAQETPYIAVIEGLIDDKELAFIEDITDNVLTIRVDVPDDEARIERYVDRELDNQSRGVVDEELIADLETKQFKRHRYERPYPPQDVTILNTDSVSTTELSDRCGNIVSLVTDTPCADLS